MSRPIQVWAKVTLQLLLTLGVTWFILTRVGVTAEEVRASLVALPNLQFGWLILSGALLLVGFLLAARSWGWMVEELGGRDPGASASMRVVLLSNLGRYIPGKLWQIAGLALLGRKSGTSATLSTASGLLGLCFGLGAAMIFALPAILRVSGDSGQGSTTLLVGFALLLILGAVSIPSLLRRGLEVIFRLARLPKEELPRGSASFGPRWLGWHLFIWTIYGGAFLLFIQAVGFNGGHLFFASAFAAAYLLGYVALFAPAGIGVREVVLVALLRPEVGNSAVGIAVLARLWITVFEILPASLLALQAMRGRGGESR